MAITAVVLGGTSVFGGRGTLGGTIIGLFMIGVLKNGLQLATLPTAPQYWGATPTDLVPCLRKPLLSTAHTASGWASRGAR